MQLTIDNLDGLGPIDYTAAVDCAQPFEILRTLNAPSVLKGMLCLEGTALAVPARRGRVVVESDTGTTLFTGYLTIEPTQVYAGAASEGAVYRLAVDAVSDEWLLDKQSWGSTVGNALGATGTGLLASLAGRLQAGQIAVSGPANARAVGVFEPVKGAKWSEHAGAIADATYTSYRALAGTASLGAVALTVHPLSEGDGSLTLSALKTSSVRELANDVTVTGAEEPAAYWTELFQGDGTTTAFDLLGEPDAPSAGHATLIAEPFNEPSLNLRLWQLSDPAGHIGLSSAGLTVSGGTGLDGQTTLSAWDQLELGGTIVVELDSVLLAAGSAGLIGGLYNGAISQANCFAGFNIRQSGGATLATPMVNGVEVRTSLTVLTGRPYTLRLRLHCPEMLRVKQAYYAMSDAAGSVEVARFGSGLNAAPLSLVFEARDQSLASNLPTTVLYDGSVGSSPALATVVAVDSLSLVGSIGAFNVTVTGSCWVRSTSASGGSWTRLTGKAAQGADCSVTSSANGHVTFFAGRVPAPGETVAVTYRGRRRSVARVADPASLAAEAAGGTVGTARWLGHVVQPPARCQEDCENAAQAILSFASNRAAALSGSYHAVNPPTGDIWPGDVLAITTGDQTLNVMVRRVAVSQQGASPEALTYKIAFANDWAEGLGIKLSETIAKDALLPTAALDLIDSSSGPTMPVHSLANLSQITVAGPMAGSLTVDAGIDPPAGGGFEVRRRDGGFGTGTSGSANGDLVLRSPVRGFSIPVSAVPETFFIRTYDASMPPLYSRVSAAIVNQKP